MNPHDKAHELLRAIQASDSYTAMKRARVQIEPDEQAKRMLQDFHMKQLQFAQMQMMGQEPSPEEQESLHNLNEILQLHPAVREYLMAEYHLSVMMQDVYKILGDGLQEVSIGEQLRFPG